MNLELMVGPSYWIQIETGIKVTIQSQLHSPQPLQKAVIDAQKSQNQRYNKADISSMYHVYESNDQKLYKPSMEFHVQKQWKKS